MLLPAMVTATMASTKADHPNSTINTNHRVLSMLRPCHRQSPVPVVLMALASIVEIQVASKVLLDSKASIKVPL